jgi:isoquinoline 1-oxidoreductase alpha subunit
MATSLTFNINGVNHTVSVPNSGMPFLWVLRDIVGLTGTKYGCGVEICGACTVLVDGQPQKSCDMDATEAVGRKIVTVEGLSLDPDGQKAQKAWIAAQVPQCGYCQSGMLVATVGAMKAGHHGSDIANEVDNLCVCGTYQRIHAAMQTL